MNRQTLFFCATAALAGMLVLSCNKSDNPTGPGDTSAPWTYTVEGNLLIITHPEVIGTYCQGVTLVPDTTPSYIDTSEFVLSGNGDTLYVQTDEDIMVLTRIGSGSGIQGQWLMSEQGFDMTITVTSSTITASACFSDMFMLIYGTFLSGYNVNINPGSCASVTITGLTTGETVTITGAQVGDSPDNMGFNMTFSSSDQTHASTTIYANPTMCPNNGPAWWPAFLAANQ